MQSNHSNVQTDEQQLLSRLSCEWLSEFYNEELEATTKQQNALCSDEQEKNRLIQ